MITDHAAIAQAAIRISRHARKTPGMQIEAPGVLVPLALKLELARHSGSFKPRGAFNNLVGRRIPEAGIAAASGGNHAAAVAYAASMLKLPVRIFVPNISSPAKVARISGYGATVVQDSANNRWLSLAAWTMWRKVALCI
jgi:threonine dehydratase